MVSRKEPVGVRGRERRLAFSAKPATDLICANKALVDKSSGLSPLDSTSAPRQSSADAVNTEGKTMITSGGTPSLRTLALISSVALLIIANGPVMAQTAEEQEKGYRLETMEQALQTKERFDLYGVHFDSDKATIEPESKSLLDDIATALKSFPDWRLRIVGHTDSTADPLHNLHLSVDRALAVRAALADRGVRPPKAHCVRCR